MMAMMIMMIMITMMMVMMMIDGDGYDDEDYDVDFFVSYVGERLWWPLEYPGIPSSLFILDLKEGKL